MKDTSAETAYIWEITDYFCRLAGRVAIISSEETELLIRWRREGVAKQDVLRGIRKAFESGRETKNLKISGCAHFVEQFFHRSRARDLYPKKSPPGAQQPDFHSAVVSLSARTAKAADGTEDVHLKKCLGDAQKYLAEISAQQTGAYETAQKLRAKLCADLIAGFDSARAESVRQRALKTVSRGRKFINEDEKNKALAACENDIIMSETGLEHLFFQIGANGR